MALFKALCWALTFIVRIRFPPGTSLSTVFNGKIKYSVLVLKIYLKTFNSDVINFCISIVRKYHFQRLSNSA